MTQMTISAFEQTIIANGSNDLDSADPTGAGGAPLAPSGFTATYLSDTSLTLAWTDNSSNELNFEIDRSPNGTDTWTALSDPAANATSATNTGLTVDTTYYYRLRAVNASGNSAYVTTSGLTAAGVTWRGNEPVGMTSLETRDFAQLGETGWKDPLDSDYANTISGNYSTITVASTYGGTDSGRITFPTGFTGGSAPSGGGALNAIASWSYQSAIWPSGGSRDLYFALEFQVSSNWQNHPTGTNKIFFVTMDEHGGGGDPCFISLETNLSGGTAPPQIMIRQQGTGGVSVPSTTLSAEVEIVYGQSYLIEVHLKANTTSSSTDGELHLWVDGTKTQEDLSCSWANINSPTWDNLRWEPTWGGAGGTVTSDMHQQMSIIYASYK